MFHFFIWAHVDSPPLKLGNNKFKKHFASRCSFERARRRTRSDWSHVENEPQSSRETKWPRAKIVQKSRKKIYINYIYIYDLWWNGMFGRLVNLACSKKALLCWKISQRVSILRTQEAKPFREVHLWNEVQPMSPLSLNHDHLIRSQNHVCMVVVDGTAVWNSHLQSYIRKIKTRMVPLMSSMTMPFNICFMFSHLGEEVKTSVAHQEPPRCWLDSHGIAGAVLRGFTQCQAAAVLISF